MKLTLLQTNITWASPADNVQHDAQLMEQYPGADLYVLPEMWATGFATTPHNIAEEEENSVALQWMKRTAAERHCAISGSLAVRTADGNYRNRHYFVTDEGVTTYDKHVGNHLLVDRDAGAQGAQVQGGGHSGLAFLAQHEVHKLLGGFHVGSALDDLHRFAGIHGALGGVDDLHRLFTLGLQFHAGVFIAQAHSDGECVVTAELDFDALDKVRNRFRVLDDRDTEI